MVHATGFCEMKRQTDSSVNKSVVGNGYMTTLFQLHKYSVESDGNMIKNGE
jgi:hypothetical protein